MVNFTFPGCLLLIIFLILAILLMKEFWFVFVSIAAVIIILYYGKLLHSQWKANKEQNAIPNDGEVFKICPQCGMQVKINVTRCPKCNKELL